MASWTCINNYGPGNSPGPWFNIKISSYQYRKSHCGDKTVVRSSYLHNGISYALAHHTEAEMATQGVNVLRLFAFFYVLLLQLIATCQWWVNFYPRPVLAFGYCRCLRLSVCVCVRPCVNHELVRAITCHPFKLESPNLDHKCKTPWLRSLLFLGLIDLELQGQIKPKSNKLPHFELLRAIIHHLSQLGFPNLDQNCTLALLRSLLILAFIDIVLQFHL